jgi:hypothetical protein
VEREVEKARVKRIQERAKELDSREARLERAAEKVRQQQMSEHAKLIDAMREEAEHRAAYGAQPGKKGPNPVLQRAKERAEANYVQATMRKIANDVPDGTARSVADQEAKPWSSRMDSEAHSMTREMRVLYPEGIAKPAATTKAAGSTGGRQSRQQQQQQQQQEQRARVGEQVTGGSAANGGGGGGGGAGGVPWGEPMGTDISFIKTSTFPLSMAGDEHGSRPHAATAAAAARGSSSKATLAQQVLSLFHSPPLE